MKKSLNKSVVLLFALALVLAVVLAIIPTMFGETASEKAHAEGRTINVTELERSQVGSGELVVSDGDILTGRTQGGHYGNPGSSTVTQGYAFWVKIPDGATITFKDMIMNTLLDFEGIPNFTCDGGNRLRAKRDRSDDREERTFGRSDRGYRHRRSDRRVTACLRRTLLVEQEEDRQTRVR